MNAFLSKLQHGRKAYISYTLPLQAPSNGTNVADDTGTYIALSPCFWTCKPGRLWEIEIISRKYPPVAAEKIPNATKS
jgi:hypothetical protein